MSDLTETERKKARLTGAMTLVLAAGLLAGAWFYDAEIKGREVERFCASLRPGMEAAEAKSRGLGEGLLLVADEKEFLYLGRSSFFVKWRVCQINVKGGRVVSATLDQPGEEE